MAKITKREEDLAKIDYRGMFPVNDDGTVSAAPVHITKDTHKERMDALAKMGSPTDDGELPDGYKKSIRCRIRGYFDNIVCDRLPAYNGSLREHKAGVNYLRSNLGDAMLAVYQQEIDGQITSVNKLKRDIFDYVEMLEKHRVYDRYLNLLLNYRIYKNTSAGLPLFEAGGQELTFAEWCGYLLVDKWDGFEVVWIHENTGEWLEDNPAYHIDKYAKGRMRELSFEPYEKQRLFLSSNIDEILYGGARGGAKSYALIHDAALHVRRWHYDENNKVVIDSQSIDYADYTALILRRNYRDLVVNFKPVSDKIYTALGAKWKDKDGYYLFPSGARIYLGYCNEPKDVEKYVGGNFHYLGIEEVNQFPEKWVTDMGGSVRSANPDIKPFKRYTTNPGGIGHIWLKRRFVDPMPPIKGEMIHSDKHDIDYCILDPSPPVKDDDGNERWYIPATVFDNQALIDNDKKYVSFLKSLTGVKRKMWLNGEWDEMSGLFFNEWNAAYHVMARKSFDLEYAKENGRMYRCIDYGTSNPFVCLFVWVDEDGRVVVFDEIYEAGLTPTVQAKFILDRGRSLGLNEDSFYNTIVDPSMKTATHDSGTRLKSVVEIYIDNGLQHIALGNNSRVQGWGVFKDYLHIDDPDFTGDYIPYLRFCDNCVRCIETIPVLTTDDNNIEDVDTDQDDHGADALRYLLMFTSASGRKPKDVNPKPKWLRDLEEKGKNGEGHSVEDAWTA